MENSYIEEETEKSFNELLIKQDQKEIILNLKEFNKKHEAIKSRIIMLSIKKIMGNVNNVQNIHIKDIIKLCKNNIGNKYLTPNKHIKILVNNGKIYIQFIEM